MASYTPNLDLLKKDPVADAGDTFNIKTMMNDNWDKIDDGFGTLQTEITENIAENIYGVATGTNTLVMTNEKVSTYKTGMLVAFKNTTANTGAVTLNINNLGAKSIKKSNGNDLNSGNLKPGGIYQVRYDGTNFFLLGEGGEYGNATPSDVLAGKTIGTENGIVNGTMSNKSGQNLTIAYYDQIASLIPHPQDPGGQGLLTVNNGTNQVGYIDGSTKFNMNIANLVPKNIVEGVKVGKINGVGNEVMVGTATVESMGGKKYASGSAIVSTATTTFGGMNAQLVTVSLDFKPNHVFLGGGAELTLYTTTISSNWNNVRILDGSYKTFTGGTLSSPLYANESGFCLPVYGQPGREISYVAYE